jgi:4'-phosphopantetheinyl transferase
MDVYWLEQTEADVPQRSDWLSASEAARLNDMRFAKRRADWRLGRWTAKRAVAVCLNVPAHPQGLAEMEIRPAPSGAPEVFFANKSAPVTISLSHRAGTAVCAVALSGAALGCDLELIEPRSDGFVADYFTTEEQALVARAFAADRPRLCALLWSGKESALKALRAGLRLDTRCVSVEAFGIQHRQSEIGSPDNAFEHQGKDGDGCLGDSGLAVPLANGLYNWRPLCVRSSDGQSFRGWWHHTDKLLRTMVAAPPPALPILLTNPT